VHELRKRQEELDPKPSPPAEKKNLAEGKERAKRKKKNQKIKVLTNSLKGSTKILGRG